MAEYLIKTITLEVTFDLSAWQVAQTRLFSGPLPQRGLSFVPAATASCRRHRFNLLAFPEVFGGNCQPPFVPLTFCLCLIVCLTGER